MSQVIPSAIGDTQDQLAPKPAMAPRRGVAVGIAVSIVLHVLLIFGYRIGIPPGPVPPGEPARAITVWLRPAPPPVPPALPKEIPPPKVVAKVRPPPKKPKDEEKLAAKAGKPQPAATATATAPLPETAATSQAITLPPPSSPPADPLHPELQPKKFDMEAALKTARKVANEKDPARANLPVAQLDTHPLYPEETETKLARDIKGAKRSDCKDANGAGLLSPLLWMLDKKDHGCKW